MFGRSRETPGDAVDRVTASLTLAPTSTSDPSTFPFASPWTGSDSHLEKIVFLDAFPDGIPSNTRRAALALPPIARARLMLVTGVSRHPLIDLVGDEPNPNQPTWLYRTNRTMPRQRIVWTVDDHLFYGWSCWWTDRGVDGFPLHSHRVNAGEWRVNADLKIEIQGKVVSDEQAILIPGYHEGILNFGREAIADAKQLYWIVRDRLANPVPMTELHQVSGADLNKEQRDELTSHWRLARTQEGGGVGFTNKHIELKAHGGDGDATLLIDARNAAAVDMARLVGVSAGMLDATTPKASLTYETRTGRNQEFVDLDLASYMNPIEDRLSMDDIVPAGHRIAFDRADFTAPAPAATGPTLQD
jgi:hypothetical protein